jgi:hypothetical protein
MMPLSLSGGFGGWVNSGIGMNGKLFKLELNNSMLQFLIIIMDMEEIPLLEL